ncbi:MAG: Flp pilus assembly complex ATPase component TadA [Candidatus Gastranaerophilales bacterium]|nr:Flp pilus assembly complex ATPase component TadA [Candidatus Gastranaerophilales bacterium]
MSLKDRLNTAQKQVVPTVQKQEEQPKYYTTNSEAQIDSLGILDTLLADDDLNNVFVSGAKNIYLEKKGKVTKSTSTFRDNIQLENIIKKIAQNAGVELNEKNSYIEFNYEQGINVVATLPPLSNVATLFVKSYKDKHATLQTLQSEHSISKEIALILEAFCAIKKNILIVGEKNTLKTTLLSSLAKKIPSNNRAVIIDCENEFKIISQNHTNYDFSKLDNVKITKSLIDSIVNSNPDKLFINTKNDLIITHTIKKIGSNHKGLIMTMLANNSQEAIEKLSQILSENTPHLSIHEAKKIILNTFDIVITTSKDEIGRRKISTISEINLLNEDNYIENIFALDYLQQHKSQGVIPKFYTDIKENSLPIGENIFNLEYKHTYHKSSIDSQYAKKNANIDILKKFKKELPIANSEETTEEIKEETNITPQEEIPEQQSQLTQEELMQKAQEKFDELKKNAQMQGEFELRVQDFEESNDEI